MIRTISDLKLSGHSFLNFMQDLEDYIEEELEQTPTYVTLDNCDYLDILFESYYAERYVSPLIDLLYKSNNNVVDATLIRNITIIMYQKYHSKWDRLWSVIQTQYDALGNIDVTDERTPSLYKKTNINTNITESVSDKYNSFQQNESIPVQDSTKTTSGSSVNNEQLENEYGKETTTRKGNDKYTKQELMIQEFELRKQNFFDMLFSDYAYELTLEIY